MSFLPEVVGHDGVREFLRGVCHTGRIPPGFLFHGDEGRGKATAARALARRMFCRNGDSCGRCSSCLQMAGGHFADFDWVAAAEGKAVIPIDRVRALREWFARAPYESDRRIAVIDGAHQLGTEAQNSLLKLLEEPPGSGFFILVTPDPARLLETVVSRLQRVFFGPLGDEQILEIVRRSHPEHEKRARTLLPFARGSAGRMTALLAGGDEPRSALAAKELLDRRTGPFSFAERVLGGRGKGRDLRNECRELFGSGLELLSRELHARLRGGGRPLPELSDGLMQQDFEGLMEILIEADRRVGAAATPRLVLEATKIRVHRILARSAKRA
ncbi:MAG: AAA family ATPase [Planctomycetes bacterium]|nr:AAA family ATPase [Planctomycetota bacterium]